LTMPLGVVLRAMRMKFGDESGWSWDRLHALRFRHPLGAGGRILDWFFSRGTLPMVGDSTTVRKATTVARAPFVVTELSSYRQIRDVGQRDRTLAINTTGQSGNPMSTHYFDQALYGRRASIVCFRSRGVIGAGQGFTPAVNTVENWTGRLFRASRRRAAGSRRVGATTGGLPYAEQRR
jgi:hypothetical protein